MLVCLSIQLFELIHGFSRNLCGRYAIRRHLNLEHRNFLQPLITRWRIIKIVMWKRHKQQMTSDSEMTCGDKALNVKHFV
jgi:hypothetical protein